MNKTSEALLQVDCVSKHFDGVAALSDYSLSLYDGDLVGLIGPNGAGKTTVFNVLSGVILPTSGKIFLQGKDITTLSADKVARAGVSRTFQNIRLFQDMSVRDNILTAFHHSLGKGFFSTLFHTPSYVASERKMLELGEYYAEIVGISHLLSKKANDLPYGDQRRLEIVRALATSPKVLLLDEPAAGMNPNETKELAHVIKQIHEELQVTILLVEHDMPFVMGLCHRLQVLASGRLLMEGSPEEVRNDSNVIAAYLGSSSKRKKG